MCFEMEEVRVPAIVYPNDNRVMSPIFCVRRVSGCEGVLMGQGAELEAVRQRCGFRYLTTDIEVLCKIDIGRQENSLEWWIEHPANQHDWFN